MSLWQYRLLMERWSGSSYRYDILLLRVNNLKVSILKPIVCPQTPKNLLDKRSFSLFESWLFHNMVSVVLQRTLCNFFEGLSATYLSFEACLSIKCEQGGNEHEPVFHFIIKIQEKTFAFPCLLAAIWIFWVPIQAILLLGFKHVGKFPVPMATNSTQSDALNKIMSFSFCCSVYHNMQFLSIVFL